MPLLIIENPVEKSELIKLANERFGDLVKAVVDIEQGIIAMGGELHSDEEALLLENGSHQKNLWGINLYPHKPDEELIEFDSIINLRPSQGNSSRDVLDPMARKQIEKIVEKLIKKSYD